MSKFYYFPQVASTNLEAQRLGKEGEASGTFVLAGRQTRGKGRGAHGWESAPGGIYLSVLLRGEIAPDRLNGFQLLIALAAVEIIGAICGIKAQIRLPNDLYYRDKKIGGILLESQLRGERLDFLVAGLGINLNQREADFSPALAPLATSLFLACGAEQPRGRIVAGLMKKIPAYWERFVREGPAPFGGEIRKNCDSFGKKVVFQSERGECRGIFRSLTPQGTFWLERENSEPIEIRQITGLEILPP